MNKSKSVQKANRRKFKEKKKCCDDSLTVGIVDAVPSSLLSSVLFFFKTIEKETTTISLIRFTRIELSINGSVT